MKFIIISIISVSLASCASTASTKRLNEAEGKIKDFGLAEAFIYAELIDSSGSSSEELKIKKNKAINQANSSCKVPYETEMENQIQKISQTQDVNAFLSLPNYAHELDKSMDKCLIKFGLKGRLAAKYKNNIYSIPEAISLAIKTTQEYVDAKATVEKEKRENATTIAGLALVAGAVALASNSSGGGYIPNSKSSSTASYPYGSIGSPVYGAAGTTYRSIGNTVYGSDGTTYRSIGNTVYGSDGTTYRSIGNTVYGSDGTTYRSIGNTVYGSDGTTYRSIGNTVYGSNGVTCRTIGNSVYCN